MKAGIEWQWVGAGADGLACDLKSPGFKVLCANTKRVVGRCEPVADTVCRSAALRVGLGRVASDAFVSWCGVM